MAPIADRLLKPELNFPGPSPRNPKKNSPAFKTRPFCRGLLNIAGSAITNGAQFHFVFRTASPLKNWKFTSKLKGYRDIFNRFETQKRDFSYHNVCIREKRSD